MTLAMFQGLNSRVWLMVNLVDKSEIEHFHPRKMFWSPRQQFPVLRQASFQTKSQTSFSETSTALKKIGTYF